MGLPSPLPPPTWTMPTWPSTPPTACPGCGWAISCRSSSSGVWRAEAALDGWGSPGTGNRWARDRGAFGSSSWRKPLYWAPVGSDATGGTGPVAPPSARAPPASAPPTSSAGAARCSWGARPCGEVATWACGSELAPPVNWGASQSELTAVWAFGGETCAAEAAKAAGCGPPAAPAGAAPAGATAAEEASGGALKGWGNWLTGGCASAA